MKKTTSFFILAIFVVAIYQNVSAQIKLESNGKVQMGTRTSTRTDDPSNDIISFIYGNGTTNNCKGRLAFGDYGTSTNNGVNVFIGESGTTDSDILQLHGKKGLRFTYNGKGTDLGMRLTPDSGLVVSKDIWINGTTKLTSDEKLKTNIKPLNGSLSLVKQMKGISFNYLPIISSSIDYSKMDITNLSEKEKREIEEEIEKKPAPQQERLGFLAQDMQKVVPQLVENGPEGNLYIDYIGVIPILVEALKEQQTMLDAQKSQISDLQTQLQSCCEKNQLKSLLLGETDINTGGTAPALYQNNPNPFSAQTEIRFFLPESVKSATLYIYDMQGTQLKSIPIQQRGNGSVTIQGAELQAGMYLYALTADGQEVDTKRMILTK